MNLYLGIDFGTSGARVNVIDAAGIVLYERDRTFPATTPEQQPHLWQQTLFELIQEIPEALRSHLSRIAINGTSSTVLLCDAQGEPLHPPLMYSDTCADAIVEQLAHIAPAGHPVLSASSSLVKLLWLSHQIQGAQARYFLHQTDWLGFLLHGQLGISDYHNSLKLGYDPATETYPDWFKHPDLACLQPLLPRVVAPGTVVGGVTAAIARSLNLPPACQICAGTTDSIAAFLASGASQPGEAVTSLGSTLVLKLLSQTRVDKADYGIYSHRLGHAWLVGGASNAGGAVLQQFFTPEELVHYSQQIDPSQESPLDYYPLLKPGERFPINDPHWPPQLEPRPASAIAFLHGLLESLARIEAQGYDLLAAQGATPLCRVYTAGGGAQNITWQTIRERHLQVPVVISQHTQAAYGTALLAAHGLQCFP